MRLTFLRPWRRRSRSSQEVAPDGLTRDEQLRELGQMLMQRREAEGLTLRQLAQETRITTPVLEALERGSNEFALLDCPLLNLESGLQERSELRARQGLEDEAIR